MQAGKILSGTILQGEYVLLGPIGEAGHDVFRAHHHRDARLVAVRIWRGSATSAAHCDLSAAQTAIRLRNPLLATVEACGRERDGLWFVVSEYVAGQRLDQWADTLGIPPIPAVIDYLHRLCLALHIVHRAGLAHCGVNPRNLVMIRGSGAPGQALNAKLLDLGVPAFMRSKPPRLRSALFMAPEQLAAMLQTGSETALETDSRVDVYALGCLLYYLCTGGTPFPSRSLRELSASHAGSKPPLPSRINPAIPEALDAIMLRALSPHARDRYRDGAELANALDEVRRSSSVSGVMPTVSALSQSSQEAAGEAPTIIYEGDFEERPTADGALPTVLLREDLSKEALQDSDHAPPEISRNDATTERPPPANVPAGSFADVVPPPAGRVPDLRAALNPLAPVFAPIDVPPPRSRPSTPPSGSHARPTRNSVQPPTLPVLPATPGSGLALIPATSIEPTTAGRATYPTNRRWLYEWWLWAAAGVLSVGVYLQLERWDMPPKVQRTTTVSSSRIVQPSLSPEPTRPPPSSPALPRTEPEPAAAATTEPRSGRADRATAARQSASKPAARAITAGVPPATTRGVRGERTLIQKALTQPTISPAQRAVLEGIANQTGEQAAAEAAQTQETSARTNNPAGPELAVPPDSHRSPQQVEPATAASAHAAAPAAGAALQAKHAPQPLAADARILELSVRGSLATSEVRRAVERIRPLLSACYARAAKAAGRNGFGEVSVEVAIDEAGRAHKAHASGGELPLLDRCVEQSVGTVVSGRPPDTGTVKASWRVAFAPRAP